jgi:protease I
MGLNGTHVVVLAAQEYEDLELWYPKLRLEEAGASVIVAGLGETLYLSKHGYPVHPDAGIADLDPAACDGVVIPGGWAPDFLRRSEAVKTFVAQVAASGGLVAAICHGGSVLISANVVKGKRLTSVAAIRDDLRNAGAEWVDAPVVVDGAMVTSRRPADLPIFMAAVLAVLDDRSHHESGVRLAVDADLVALTLADASLEYMLDMLNRMPAAKGYREGIAPATHSPAQILRDFASLSDPRGPLEVEAAVVVDVVPTVEGYVARGNARLLSVLEGAGVPAVKARI